MAELKVAMKKQIAGEPVFEESPEVLTPKKESFGFDDYKAMETRMFEMGFKSGMEKARAENPPKDPYAGLETTRSAREKRKLKRAQEIRHAAFLKKTEEQLQKFIKRNADELWEYVPTLYHTQRDDHHHLGKDEWLDSKVKEYCASKFNGNTAKMLHTFEDQEVVERLRGSHNMFRTLQPTARVEVPNSIKKQSPNVYGHGYETDRKLHEQRLTRIFTQPSEEFFNQTNGGNAGFEFRRTKKSSNPFCDPGPMGRTNLAGWADANSKEGIGGQPPFLRGSQFAMAHEGF